MQAIQRTSDPSDPCIDLFVKNAWIVRKVGPTLRQVDSLLSCLCVPFGSFRSRCDVHCRVQFSSSDMVLAFPNACARLCHGLTTMAMGVSDNYQIQPLINLDREQGWTTGLRPVRRARSLHSLQISFPGVFTHGVSENAHHCLRKTVCQWRPELRQIS